MRLLLRFLVIYLFFMFQYAVVKLPLEILLLVIVILSLYDEPYYALINAFWAGTLLDLAAPLYLGFHVVFFVLVAYSLSNIRRALYNNRIYFLVIVALALITKYLLGLLILKTNIRFVSWLVSFIILLSIAIPLDFLIIRIILRKWPSVPKESLY
ncbi:MAG: hypothetical protein ABIK10_00685 [candidate division WOR-3 bacterium]